MPRHSITQAELKELYDYDPATGRFTHKATNKLAGNPNKPRGYVSLTINKKRYYAHRLAWLFAYGEWPAKSIDHINRDPADNRLQNLRVASQSENNQNRKTRGVSYIKGRQGGKKYTAQICHEGRKYQLGYYETEAEAHAAYLGAKRVLHPCRPRRLV